MAYLSYLINNRVREAPFSHAWFKIWAKRMVNMKSLAVLLFKVFRLKLKGASIGELSILHAVELNGKASNLQMGRESVIGNRVHLALHDSIYIGNCVAINDGCVLLTASHDVNDPQWGHAKAPIVIEDYAWVATNSIVLPGVTIGYGSVVGAGAVVTRDVPAFSIVAGNPARVVKERSIRQFSYSPVRFLAPIEAWVGVRSK